MKVEEVRSGGGGNTTGADTTAPMRAYRARTRLVGARSALLVLPLALVLAVWSPLAGLGLLVGGVSGVANMVLVVRNNEAFLEGRRGRGARALNNLVRIVAVAAIPAVLAAHQLWAMAAYFAGFFTPLLLYARASGHDTRGT